ncbi:HAD domain-containing protein [Conchiformibius steedae]|uniref:HAD family hydrolase n=1 Tax=Conchiformibius steedae TaxID=153493 RepID=A0A3P2ABE8_9NEIS|nr:HAD domain-containing protein [Conchiformibius steedae]RRD90943.1 hypothetical protein EII21_03035 [Conchiformibius steedae]
MIIFLDFDGVLHPNLALRQGSRLWQQLPVFTTFLSQKEWADCAVVVSSSWRIGRDLAQLQTVFPPDLRPRIIGTTPILHTHNRTRGSRQREIECWLRDFAYPADAWLALDDTAWYFDEHCPHLFLCNGQTGLIHADLPRLHAQLHTLSAKPLP